MNHDSTSNDSPLSSTNPRNANGTAANVGGPGNPLHVLLVSASSGSQGGGELYLSNLADQLSADGHRVEVVLSNHGRMDSLANIISKKVKICRVPYVNSYDRRLRVAGSVLNRRSVREMTQVFQQISPDIIHINKQNVEDGLDLVLAARRAGLPNVTTIHITHSMRSLGAVGGKLRDAITRWVLIDSSSHYLVTANCCRLELSDYLRTRASPATIHLVRNGVLPAPDSDRMALRREWNCRPQEIVLGCVARIEQQKNPLFLIDILANLPQEVRLVWVGDGRLRSEFESAAARAGVADRLRIEGWRSDARSRMAGFDIFVLPSQFEGFPFAVLEAMAAGLPCLVSNADGTREAIMDGQHGRILAPGDRQAWLTAIKQAVENVNLRNQWGQAARERYWKYFSSATMARGTVEVYRQILSEFKPR